MLLTKFPLIFGLTWLVITLIAASVHMFPCVAPCQSTYDTARGLHRHESGCRIYLAVEDLKLRQRRERASARGSSNPQPRPHKKAKIQQVWSLLIFIIMTDKFDQSRMILNHLGLPMYFPSLNLVHQHRLVFPHLVACCGRTENLSGFEMSLRRVRLPSPPPLHS